METKVEWFKTHFKSYILVFRLPFQNFTVHVTWNKKFRNERAGRAGIDKSKNAGHCLLLSAHPYTRHAKISTRHGDSCRLVALQRLPHHRYTDIPHNNISRKCPVKFRRNSLGGSERPSDDRRHLSYPESPLWVEAEYAYIEAIWRLTQKVKNSQDRVSPSWDTNPRSCKYETYVLTNRSRRSYKIFNFWCDEVFLYTRCRKLKTRNCY